MIEGITGIYTGSIHEQDPPPVQLEGMWIFFLFLELPKNVFYDSLIVELNISFKLILCRSRP